MSLICDFVNNDKFDQILCPMVKHYEVEIHSYTSVRVRGKPYFKLPSSELCIILHLVKLQYLK